MDKEIFEKILNENMPVLREMSNYYREDTDLPVNIWLDESGTYLSGGHSKRIKFQFNKGNNIGNQPTCSMTLEGKIPESEQKTLQKYSALKQKDINQVRNFVLNNVYALNLLADEKIRRKVFDQVMIKGGEPASEKQKDAQRKSIEAVLLAQRNFGKVDV